MKYIKKQKEKLFFAIIISICVTTLYAQEEQKIVLPWTWVYRKQLGNDTVKARQEQTQVLFKKEGISCFSQLVVSWNALRPIQGYYTFSGKIRDAKTKQWSPLHTMIDWGAEVQRSYLSRKGGTTHYAYVRMETEKEHLADGFCITVTAHEGASLCDIHSLAASVSDFTQFKPESVDTYTNYPSIFIKEVPKVSQFTLDHPEKDGLCSPTSTSMLVSYLTKKQVDPVLFAQAVYDDGLKKYGSWPFNTAHAYEQTEGKVLFAVARLNNFGMLHQLLKKGMPVVVSVRGALEGALLPYANGHLLVVIGYDAQSKKVICNDPATQEGNDVMRSYPLASFMSAWERSHRLAYVGEIKK